MDLTRCKGVIVPVVTPLDESENVDAAALQKIVHFLIEHGVHGIFPLGTTGEFARLDDEQKWIALEACVQAVNGRTPVYVGVSACGTKEVLNNIRRAEKLGADLVVCTLPFYYPVHEVAEQTLFFDQITAGSSLPVIIYNIPATIGCSIHLEVIEKLAVKDRIAGVKDSGGNLAYLSEIIGMKTRADLIVAAGAEKIGKEALWKGADGIVPSLANVFPSLFVDLYTACVNRELQQADRLQVKIDQINRLNACTNSWMGLLTFRKKAMSLMGLCSDRLAEPYLKLDEESIREIEILVDEMKTWA